MHESRYIVKRISCFQQNLCSGIIDLDAEIPDRTLDLGMAEQKPGGPKVSCASIDQGLPVGQPQLCAGAGVALIDRLPGLLLSQPLRSHRASRSTLPEGPQIAEVDAVYSLTRSHSRIDASWMKAR
jgi:hypothetical protein